ncbi:uncharacterized protein PAC_15916 [Phialocephala subalpina]|uniref:Zn(2)-C6 fungal-type domain-containing protein n=1 Tax=Phialocephala subalpina TaxID=576137 RepID=A0A1L7XM33_9HELO|nr:uncharacterized protein PAC_15916 [Phialocephala subalpina]
MPTTTRVLSCINCRMRKVACDRTKPACKRCSVSGKECGYRARKYKKAPRPSRVTELEARLGMSMPCVDQGEAETEDSVLEEEEEIAGWKDLNYPRFLKLERFQSLPIAEPNLLGGQEALPDARLQQHLYHVYFQQVHPSAPMIHKSRFSQALNGSPNQTPPLALRYAMWAVAASETSEHQDIAEKLYTISRKHAESLEMEGPVKPFLSTSSAQCWYLLATYEASRAYFTRAWMSVGRCVRLVQMMALHRLDSPHDEEYNLPQASSWAETEERRRTFWAAYFADRWASTISGHPLSIKDDHICTHLPSSEEAFEYELEEVGISLQQVDGVEIIPYLSLFAGSVFTTAMLGRYLRQIHLQKHRVTANADGDYWDTHRQIDTSISHVFMSLPASLRPSPVANDIQVVFLHLNLHVTVILLHQMASAKASKHRLDPSICQRSFHRCLVSSVEIKNIIYSVKDLKTFPVHIWTSFCIYVAAGVFIDDLRTTRQFSSSSVDLALLLIALRVIGARRPIMDFFARKLESDISRSGIGSYIPADLREIARISIASRTASSGGSSRDAYCGMPDEGVYK